MEQATDILKHLETPLQLAALALLVIYGIAKALIGTKRWTPSETVVALFLNRAFQLGMVAFILAVGGPLLLRAINREEFIEGSVSAQGGGAVGNAIVSAGPIGSQAVQQNGTFEIRVPDHLRRPPYSITAAAAGFKPASKTVAEADIGSVNFQLQPQPEHAVRQIMPDIVVGQFYGLPAVVVSMQTKSPTNGLVFISEITARLSSDSVSLSLFPNLVTTLSPMGPYLNVTGSVPINPGIQTTIRFMLSPSANINGLVRSISELPEYGGSAPCNQQGNGSFVPLSDRAFQMVQAFATSKFVWSPGTWTLHFKVTAADQEDLFEKSFELSTVDVQRLRDSIALIKTCLSSSFMYPLAQDGAISNYTMR